MPKLISLLFAALVGWSVSALLFLAWSIQSTTLLPCGPYRGCERILYQGAMRIVGVPLWVVGLVFLTVTVVAVSKRLVWLSGLTALVGAAIFARYSADVARTNEVCPWCILPAIGMGVLGIASPFAAKYAKWQMDLLGYGIVGVGLTFLVPNLWVPPAKASATSPSPNLDYAAANRLEVTGRPDQKSLDYVLWGSPSCPATVAAFSRWLEEGKHRKARLTFRFAPVTGSPEERMAATLLKIALDRGDNISPFLMPKVSAATLMQGATRSGVPLVRIAYVEGQVSEDMLAARRMSVTRVPLMLTCPPNEGCQPQKPGASRVR